LDFIFNFRIWIQCIVVLDKLEQSVAPHSKV